MKKGFKSCPVRIPEIREVKFSFNLLKKIGKKNNGFDLYF